MSNTLTIALVQSNLIWENPEANRTQFTEKVNSIKQAVDLIIFPEMFTSGFTMNPTEVAEPINGKTVKWMQQLAKENNCAITGSLVIKDNEAYYNRLVFVSPDQTITYYNKRHTFTLAGEDKAYKAGTEKMMINYKGWKICPQVCYDLRFPVWARNTESYDVLMYVANWPKPRINAWDALLKARAIENMSYCIGVNRVGVDNTGHEYPGHSAVYDVLGNRLDTIQEDEEAIGIVELDKNQIQKYRSKLGFLNDKDSFSLEV